METFATPMLSITSTRFGHCFTVPAVEAGSGVTTRRCNISLKRRALRDIPTAISSKTLLHGFRLQLKVLPHHIRIERLLIWLPPAFSGNTRRRTTYKAITLSHPLTPQHKRLPTTPLGPVNADTLSPPSQTLHRPVTRIAYLQG
jgi:hypothetical protein